MRWSIFCAIVLMVLITRACHAFDAEKYSQDHKATLDFARDVDRAKGEMLNGKPNAGSSPRRMQTLPGTYTATCC